VLPPGWLLAAKLLALGLFPGRRLWAAGPPFLPFFSWLDAPVFAPWLEPVVIVVFHGAVLALMFNRLVRAACLAIAGCVFVHIAAHRLEYANSLLFPGVFLLLIGTYTAQTGLWPLRFQLALVYFGASLNKALDADWWHGRFFDTLMIEALHVRWYALAAGHLPEHWLGAFLGALTIVTEASIALVALLCRNASVGVLMMIVFHATMLVLTSGQLSVPFLYAALAIAPPFVEASRTSGQMRQVPPLMWWAAALLVRFLPRLLSYAQSVH